ncbi:UNVERIFIED_ORG: hypothetical protein J2W74_000065 [Methylorubrum zatmanii]
MTLRKVSDEVRWQDRRRNIVAKAFFVHVPTWNASHED